MLHPKKKQPKVVVSIERFYPLNGRMEDKQLKSEENMGTYTIFVNKKHTLAHVFPKGNDMYMRVPIRAKLVNQSDEVVEAYFTVRLRAYLLGF